MTKLAKIFLLCAAQIALACPARVKAQFVRQDTQATSSGQSDGKTTPSGKRRVSQEVQITGQQPWSDTGIDVQPGEHIVVTATGKLRYADAKEDNGPDGITRGFKDLLRILPFNSAGRGALIGRIGDAEIAQPFLVGAHRDFVASVQFTNCAAKSALFWLIFAPESAPLTTIPFPTNCASGINSESFGCRASAP